jgi:hypothetical protein
MMALHSDVEFGPGKSFLIEAVCRLAEQLETSDLAPLAAVVAPSVAVVAAGRNAGRGMLPGALAIAALAGNDGLATRMTEMLAVAGDDQSELLLRILPTLPQLDGPAAERIEQLIAGRYLEDPTPLHRALTELDATSALRLWDSAESAIQTALTALQQQAPEPQPGTGRPGAPAPPPEPDSASTPSPTRETPAERYESLLDAVDRRAEGDPSLLSRALLIGQFSELGLYGAVRARVEHMLPLLTDQADRRRHALLGLARGPAEDWSFWGGVYEPAGAAPDNAAGRAAAVMISSIGTGLLPTIRQVPEIVERLAPAISLTAADDILTALKTALAAAEWDDPSQERRLLLYETCDRVGGFLNEHAKPALAGDLDRALTDNEHEPPFIEQVRRAASHLPPPAAQVLRDTLLARTGPGPELVGALRVVIAASVRCGAPALDPSLLAPVAGEEQAATVSGEWLALFPPADAAVTTFTTLGWPSESALRDYAKTLSAEDRTQLWTAAVAADVSARRLSAIAGQGLKAEAVDLIKIKIDKPQRQEQRNHAVGQLLTAPLHLPATHAPACELALNLLSGEISGDAVLAADIVIHCKGAAYGYTEKLRRALQAAEDRNDKTFTKGKKIELVKLNLLRPPPKKKSFIERGFDAVRPW